MQNNEKLLGIILAGVLLAIQAGTGLHLSGISDTIMHKDVLEERHAQRDIWREEVDRRLNLIEQKIK